MMKMFSASRVNDTTAKMSQQEIVFPVRPDSNIVPERERNGPNAIPHERNKGTFIGGGHSFTDMPPNEYGIMSKGNETVVEIFGILMTSFFFFIFFTANKLKHCQTIYYISATILVFINTLCISLSKIRSSC